MSIKFAFIRLFALLTISWFFVHSAYAIGFWYHGEVEEPPYYEKEYRFIKVSGKKYIIMNEAIAKEVVNTQDSVEKNSIDIGTIRKGDEVLIKVEGTRIYQIEILR